MDSLPLSPFHGELTDTFLKSFLLQRGKNVKKSKHASFTLEYILGEILTLELCMLIWSHFVPLAFGNSKEKPYFRKKVAKAEAKAKVRGYGKLLLAEEIEDAKLSLLSESFKYNSHFYKQDKVLKQLSLLFSLIFCPPGCLIECLPSSTDFT